MKALATFTMRSPSTAALVAAISALLSMWVPLFGIVAAAVVGLVTLRAGARAGMRVILIATLGAGAAFTLAMQSAPWQMLIVAVLSWVPLWLLALALRISRSLALSFELTLGTLALVLVLIHVLLGDPAVHWLELLEVMRESVLPSELANSAEAGAILAQLARWMSAVLAAALLVQFLLALLLARWWQALLYNPGGFGEEFRALRLHRSVALITLVVGVIALTLMPQIGLHTDLLLVLGVAFAFQGLAVAHGLRALERVGRGWLVLTYVFLVVLLPQTALLLAITGWLDVWVDFRARAARIPPKKGS